MIINLILEFRINEIIDKFKTNKVALLHAQKDISLHSISEDNFFFGHFFEMLIIF